MARIPEEVINDIRNKAAIEDVIGHYIEVIKKGNGYVAMCPFHDDHNPSLSISRDKKIFKCFVCGTAGDVFSFVQKYENTDYVTAIRKVADLIGYKYDFGTDQAVSTFTETTLHKIMRESVTFCQHELNSQAGTKMKAYLQKRNLPDEIIEKYQFGYNPSGNLLYNFLHRKGYQDKDIIEANMARLTEKGISDVFYDRLMIPVHDREGHPIAFTARTLDPNNPSKYINTTDTPLFKKSDVLFNYHRAYETARREKFMILAEGPMDVMAFDRAGMANAVCSMGTSCTRNQLSLLRRITNRLVMGFDGDKAGQDAIFKVGTLAQGLGFEVLVLNNNTDKDPDEIINSSGPDVLKGMVTNAISWIEFIFTYYRKLYSLNNYNSRKDYASHVLAEIKKLKDEFDRENYLQRLSQLTGFSTNALDKSSGEVRETRQQVEQPEVVVKAKDGLTIAERTILKQMLESPQMCNIYKQELNFLRDRLSNTLALYIIDYYNHHDTLVISDFVGSLENDQLKSLVYEIVEDSLIEDKTDEKVFRDAIKRIKVSVIDDQIAQKSQEMKNYTDSALQARIANEVVSLRKQRKALLRSK